MRNLCIALFSILFLAGVSAQINNGWEFAWQNAPIGDLCIPDLIIVALNSTTNTTSVTYYYDPVVESINCPTPLYSSNLIDISAISYIDTNNNTITWVNSTIQSVQFVLDGTSSTFFYLNTSYVFNQLVTYGIMSSYWSRSILSDSSNASLCSCAPDYLFVLPYNYRTPALKYYTFYMRPPNCSTNTSDTLSLFNSTASTINWKSNINPDIAFSFTPSSSNSTITFSFLNGECTYNYDRFNSIILNSSSWIPDWQDNGATNIYSYPSSYQVRNFSNTYMESLYIINGSNYRSYVIQNIFNGQYQDAYLNQTFTYTQPTNTLTVVDYDFIYSPTGSLFNASQFIQLWGSPNPAGSTANCCVFTYVNISQNPSNNNTLDVVYIPPEGYTDPSSPCSDFASDYTSGALESTLAIETPSLIGLTWVDQKFNTTISFLNGNSSTIAVQFPQQCGIIMVASALSESSISIKAMVLVMGLFVALACM